MKDTAKALRESFLAHTGIRIVPVIVPGSNLKLYGRNLNILETWAFDDAREKAIAAGEDAKISSLYLSLALCDEDGSSLFTLEDVDTICGMSPEILNKLFESMPGIADDPDDQAAKEEGMTPEGKS